jgi:hypothetical protein
MEEAQDRQKGLSIHITSKIIMKGLTTSHASLFEALHDVFLVSLCDFRLVIPCMRFIEFLADVGRGCAHGGANKHFGPSHSTAMTSNCRSCQGPVG